MSARTFVWTLGPNSVTVTLSGTPEQGTVRIGERNYRFRILARGTNSGLIEINDRRLRFYWTQRQRTVYLWLNGFYYELMPAGPRGATVSSEPTQQMTAPMPGTVVRVAVAKGDRVVMNQPLVIMESMKMESVLRAPKDGSVAEIKCKPGDVVEMGSVLVILEA